MGSGVQDSALRGPAGTGRSAAEQRRQRRAGLPARAHGGCLPAQECPQAMPRAAGGAEDHGLPRADLRLPLQTRWDA